MKFNFKLFLKLKKLPFFLFILFSIFLNSTLNIFNILKLNFNFYEFIKNKVYVNNRIKGKFFKWLLFKKFIFKNNFFFKSLIVTNKHKGLNYLNLIKTNKNYVFKPSLKKKRR